jgi:hypothetical protein
MGIIAKDAWLAAAVLADPDFLKFQEKAFPPVTVAVGENAPLKLVLPSK